MFSFNDDIYILYTWIIYLYSIYIYAYIYICIYMDLYIWNMLEHVGTVIGVLKNFFLGYVG